MKHWWKVIIVLMLVWSASVGAQRLQPLLPHYDGRTAIATVEALSTSVHWSRFVANIARYQSWTVAETSAFLTSHAWVMCPFTGWFASDGVYYRQGSWNMGTIYRETVQGEQFACTTDGRPVFSTRCGNAVQPPDKIPMKVRDACRNMPTEYRSVIVGAGDVITQTVSKFTPFECHLH